MVNKPEQRILDFQKMGFGLFMHWGIYAAKEIDCWEQFFQKTSSKDYEKNIESFTGEDFNAKEIVAMAKRAGMKYIVLTTRHHEGFSLYDTKGLCEFDSVHSPAKRDIVREFVDACHEQGISPFLYHTLVDWHQESYENNFNEYLVYLRKSIEILCTNYGEIGGFWFDGVWAKPDADWQEEELYKVVRKYQPNAIINNNPGWTRPGLLTHPEVDVASFEQGKPTKLDYSTMDKYVAGEMSQTICASWSYGACDLAYKSIPELITTMCFCRGAGCNYLLDITPTSTGKILDIQKAMIETLGKWININKKPFYDGMPTDIKGPGNDFALKTPDGKIYIFAFDLYNSHPRVYTGLTENISKIIWLDNEKEETFFQSEDNTLCMNLSPANSGYHMIVRVAELTVNK